MCNHCKVPEDTEHYLTATIVGQADRAPVTEYDLSMYLRPSRYAEADKFYGFAAQNSADLPTRQTLLETGVVLGRHPAELRPGLQPIRIPRGRGHPARR